MTGLPSPTRQGLVAMVCAADQLAALAGAAMLERGGSAGDAIVAAGAVMAVTSPHLCGMGGDALAMIAAPGSPPIALLSVGRAGTNADPDRLRASGHRVMPLRREVASTTVPGAVDGWLALHQRFGRLPLDTVFEPALVLAEEGFAASELLALASHLVSAYSGASELCPDGPLAPSQRVHLPGIARTLRAIAAGGRDAFYLGEAGRALLELGEGLYAPGDLERPLAEFTEPLALRAFGHVLYTVPPPSQGYLTLAGAWIAEQCNLPDDIEDPLWAHLLIEAARAAGYDRPHVLYDGADAMVLLDPERLGRRAARIEPDRIAPPDVRAPDSGYAPAPPRIGEGDTTHLCAIDDSGLGISLTQSNALDFGSHLNLGTTGIFLHNRGLGFSLVPGHPAEFGPRRRPPHTLSPALITTADGSLTHLIGTMGGDGQPQIILQVATRLLRHRAGVHDALAGARLILDAPAAGPFRQWFGTDLGVRVESHAPDGWREGLAARGHHLLPIDPRHPTIAGSAQVIAIERRAATNERVFLGGSDPRSPEGGSVGR